ncbi:MAG: branched-chain amino acid ABC transporter permease [Bacillati bacterium ANGP1]|uniref:Branched-chain amino acid ABC transporter permease n=1 Tax=Candidatus Segetimicrobium genomatis TaxID=2569760 RepID=A0A537JYC6_9BACT|nr:MAG: branched-chain amino acid ABC transporter permease [Terrabacteria group bacterium ANGP1]
MTVFLQQLINGISLGSVYALFALGFTLIFGVLEIINLAHAAILAVGALLAYTLFTSLGAGLAVALLGASLGTGALGVVIDFAAFRPLRARRAGRLASLISSIGVALILVNLAQILWGSEPLSYPPGTVPLRFFTGGGVTVSLLQILVLATTLLLLIGLRVLLTRTKVGMAIRAVAESPATATLLGIPFDRVVVFTFFLSSALGGVAGVLVGMLLQGSVSPFMGNAYGLKGLAAIILGGMGDITGAVLGGLAMGIGEIMIVQYLNSSYRDGVAFGLLFLVLVIRPTGLLGQQRSREA